LDLFEIYKEGVIMAINYLTYPTKVMNIT